MSFANQLRKQDSNICLVVAPVSDDKTAWYFIRVESTKLNRFKQDVQSQAIDLTQYGRVLRRGYGEQPPQDVVDEMILEGFDPE